MTTNTTAAAPANDVASKPFLVVGLKDMKKHIPKTNNSSSKGRKCLQFLISFCGEYLRRLGLLGTFNQFPRYA
jgi:hypothetical protein